MGVENDLPTRIILDLDFTKISILDQPKLRSILRSRVNDVVSLAQRGQAPSYFLCAPSSTQAELVHLLSKDNDVRDEADDEDSIFDFIEFLDDNEISGIARFGSLESNAKHYHSAKYYYVTNKNIVASLLEKISLEYFLEEEFSIFSECKVYSTSYSNGGSGGKGIPAIADNRNDGDSPDEGSQPLLRKKPRPNDDGGHGDSEQSSKSLGSSNAQPRSLRDAGSADIDCLSKLGCGDRLNSLSKAQNLFNMGLGDPLVGNSDNNALLHKLSDYLLYGGIEIGQIDRTENYQHLNDPSGQKGFFSSVKEDYILSDETRINNSNEHPDKLILDKLVGDGNSDDTVIDGELGNEGDDLIYGDDVIFGNNDDVAAGGSGSDILTGDEGSDYLDGSDENDQIWAGSDDVMQGGDGHHTLNEGAGQDTVSYQWDPKTAKVYLGLGGANDGLGRWDTLINIENVIGSAFSDELHGDQYNNILVGLEGHDLLYGNQGNDVLLGNGGRDRLFGGDGNDTLWGGGGNDILRGGRGEDFLDGGSGDDALYGGANADRLYGQAGNDRLEGEDGNDTLYGGDGDDFISGGRDYIDGGSSHDTLYGGHGADTLLGQAGNDHLYGDDGDDLLDGGFGQDTVTGGSGQDTFIIGVKRGIDFILDFNVADDRIGLIGGLTFSQLTLVQGVGTVANSALIQFAGTGETLAALTNVNVDTLTSDLFQTMG
ncbi:MULTISPECIES: calcium-binding protein [Cyanophyceae]|uniref:calcium-binding protein n=2 Tax=Cyanobacteriota TaxID=1117 RepID=UPI001685315D|nr:MULTISPECIES: calcium-binding protein [Cyanophyceae]MBD1915359.1 hypothetical protein [Phormidium sp. FACHB-77]MBD2028923.1 hypothetical protein [Phormidium sp. FACHB-322]MBD2049371.1 hypothetical protein [Leptolyngbya sp. FACHB-60]